MSQEDEKSHGLAESLVNALQTGREFFSSLIYGLACGKYYFPWKQAIVCIQLFR